jgi:UPF0755 protein
MSRFYKKQTRLGLSSSHLAVGSSFMPPVRGRQRLWGVLLIFLLILAAAFVAVWWVVLPPAGFPAGIVVEIKPGATITEAASTLENVGVVRSELALRYFVSHTGAAIKAGRYQFAVALPVQAIARRLVAGEYGIKPLSITFPEGFTVQKMADRLAHDLPDFDKQAFLQLALPYQGYLWPDTYYLEPTATPDEVVEKLRTTFITKTNSLKSAITKSGHSLSEIITMASLVEEEASTDKDRRLIAGILWKRLAAGMPLQVDASLTYALGRSTHDLTVDDLKSDSPYNTYQSPGLPPAPISNPGLAAIKAVLEPTDSAYFYYLADQYGVTHYAETLAEHNENKATYLK